MYIYKIIKQFNINNHLISIILPEILEFYAKNLFSFSKLALRTHEHLKTSQNYEEMVFRIKTRAHLKTSQYMIGTKG